jgi:hypothetical protein
MENKNINAPVYIFFDGEQRSLRSTRRIRQGETILHLPKQIRMMPDKYSLEVTPGVHLDCEYHSVGAINHSCDPSAFVKDTRIVAWTCIDVGTPITIDYKKTEQKLANPFDCTCGSKNCRGRIE